MTKYTQFRDIPQLTQRGNYEVDYQLDYLVREIERMVQEEGLQLNPDFQRGHVWTEEQQIAYIQFLLQGGQSGRTLYLNCPSWHFPVKEGSYDDFVCVDGLQRYTAIKRFITNEIPVFGSYYREFTDSLRISRNTIRVNINDLKSKKQVLQWYLEMNGGGTPHSSEELDRVRGLWEKEQG